MYQRSNLISREEHIALRTFYFVFLAFLMQFSLEFWRERMCLFDPALFSFLVLDSGQPSAVLGRIGSWPSQVLPALSLKLGASLELFLKLYSLSFILLYFIYYLIIDFWVKHQAAAMALCITLCAGFYRTFYYSTAELYQALALCCILWALLDDTRTGAGPSGKKVYGIELHWRDLLAFALIIWISFYHQITLFPVFYVLGFTWIVSEASRRKSLGFLAVISLIWFVIRIKLLTFSDYEKGKFISVYEYWTYLWKLPELPSTIHLINNFQHFRLLIVLPIICLIVMALHRAWLAAAFYLLSFLGFILVILITFYQGESILMYENYYTVLGLFTGISLAWYVVKTSLTAKFLRPAAIVLLLGLGLLQIWEGHHTPSKKVDYLERLSSNMASQNIQKAYLPLSHYPDYYAFAHWAMPFEMMLLSTTSGLPTTTVYPDRDFEYVRGMLNARETFVGPDFQPAWFHIERVNSIPYFKLPIDRVYEALVSPAGDLKMEYIQEHLSMRSAQSLPPDVDHLRVQTVHISNKGEKRIGSGSHAEGDGLKITYHILSTEGEYLIKNVYSTRLESDIFAESNANMGVYVWTHWISGEYIIEFEILLNGEGSGVGCRSEARF